MTNDAAPTLADVNAGIGRGYDALPYDPAGSPTATPQQILATASLFGYSPPPRRSIDVLDLGCGTGSQLELIGNQVGGRLVGADISSAACERARARCERHGSRVSIRAVDLMTLQPADLGTFDFITSVGVIYVIPPQVRAHLLSLLGSCLKPGGVAVVTYYAGGTPMMRAQVFALLREGTNPDAPPVARVKEARELLNSFRGRVSEKATFRPSLDDALKYTQRLSDTVFYHEILSHTFEAVATSSLAAELAPYGLEFLDYAAPIDVGNLPTSRERARAAGLVDFSGGAYRHAIFGRPKGGATPPTVRSPNVQWTTQLQRMSPGNTLGGEVSYAVPKSEGTVRSSRIRFQALVERLIAKPQRWSQLLETVQKDVHAYDGPPATADGIAADLAYLWQRRFVTPQLLDW